MVVRRRQSPNTEYLVFAAAYLQYFADEDWHSEGKIWNYLGINAKK